MFVIFGWETTLKPVESVLKSYCYHCSNSASWTIWKENDWLSLYFLKVLPVTTKYRIACEICGDGCKLDSKLARKALNPRHRNQKLHDEVLAKLEDHQFEGLTEVQKEYRKNLRIQKNS